MRTAERQKNLHFCRQIWTNCEHARFHLQKRLFQNILENTCKNGSANPLFMRVPGGKGWKWRSPLSGHWHALLHFLMVLSMSVEMKVAPFRALTQHLHNFCPPAKLSGNEGRPFQGIDTSHSFVWLISFISVEMSVAPFRALTHCVFDLCRKDCFSRNECRPFQGIDTRYRCPSLSAYWIVEMSVAPIQGLNTWVVTTSTT